MRKLSTYRVNRPKGRPFFAKRTFPGNRTFIRMGTRVFAFWPRLK